MKSLIYGYGETGKSFERYLTNKNLEFEIFDENISKYNKRFYLSDFDQILCSPGIPKSTFEEIIKENNNVLTDIDIFFNDDKSTKIGITGTNRKSTTAFHLHQLFEDYRSSNLIGNIGKPVLDFINNNKDYSIIELSSFQLEKMKVNCLDYGVLLNIDIDHLDHHGNFESYKAAKEKILLAKKSISNITCPYELFEWITNHAAKKINFKNLPFRFEMISENIINDSKSTNFHSLSYALDETKHIFHSEYILIVCGDPAKEQNREIIIDGPKAIYIFGYHAKEIYKCISHKNKYCFNNLEDVFEFIQKNKFSQNILLSPGYPSGRDYKDFNERGEAFNRYAQNYINEYK